MRKFSRLNLLQLEDRTTPVVGAGRFVGPGIPLAEPAPIAPGGIYDGVVLIKTETETSLGFGTGSLITSASPSYGDHYILTAAHVAKEATTVYFDLPVAAGRISLSSPGGAAVIRVPIPVSIGDGMGLIHPNYDQYENTTFWDNDIAILKLVDPSDRSANRLLVRPYGAQSYAPYSPSAQYPDMELGRTVTFVGYGDTGVGATGDTIGSPGDVKRSGQNKIEFKQWQPDANYVFRSPKALVTDFDDGTAAHDAFGIMESSTGLGMGEAEAQIAHGDSGGPWFAIGPDGSKYIVGVTSGRQRYANPGPLSSKTQPDVDAILNSSFGEVSIASRVGSHYADFIEPNTKNGSYDLVFDMSTQAYGLSNPAAGGVDNLTITVRSDGIFLYISVTNGGPAGGLNGEYYMGRVSDIKSLTLRGTQDNETFRIEGDLGISGGVYIDGRLSGTDNDSVVYDNSYAGGVENHYTFDTTPGWDMQMHRGVAKYAGDPVHLLPPLYVKNVEKFSALGSQGGKDRFQVDYAPAALSSGLSLDGGTGDDDLS